LFQRHEAVDVLGDGGQGVLQRHAVRSRLGIAVFNPLQDAGDANLDELVQIAGRDGQKLHPLEERIGLVLGLLQHAAIEAEPRLVPAEK
jgi:hypothetical protein